MKICARVCVLCCRYLCATVLDRKRRDVRRDPYGVSRARPSGALARLVRGTREPGPAARVAGSMRERRRVVRVGWTRGPVTSVL